MPKYNQTRGGRAGCKEEEISTFIKREANAHTTCGSPRTSFHQFKRQLRGME